MKGRKPLPTHLKLVTGNRGRRPPNANEPRPPIAIPAMPAHLSPLAQEEWRFQAHRLASVGLLTQIDRAVFAAYCQCWADWVEAEENLAKYGKLIKSPVKKTTRTKRDGSVVVEESGGYPMQSPYLAIRNRALELMAKFAVELGLSPSSRSRVSATGGGGGGEEDDPAKKYIG